MCVPHMEDSLPFSPQLDLTHLDQPWLSSTSPRNVGAGSWVHSRQRPVIKPPKGGLGCVPQSGHTKQAGGTQAESLLLRAGESPWLWSVDWACTWTQPAACRFEPHLKVLQPSGIRHNLRLALAHREALLGAGMGTSITGLWLTTAATQPCIPRALCELWLLSSTVPWAAGQVQQLHPAEPRWNLLSAQAVLSTGPVTAPHGILSCC